MNRPLSIILWLLVSFFVMTGCGPRVGRLEAAQLDPHQLVVDLPAIYIDYDSTGEANIAGRSLTELGGMFAIDLSDLNVTPEQISILTAANIQHLQLNNTSEGLLLSVNGEMIPSLLWNGTVLQSTVETLESFRLPMPALLKELLPLVTQLGMGMVVRFPVMEGKALIPLAVTGENSAAARTRRSQELLPAVGIAQAITFTVDYALDGTWTLNRRNVQEWNVFAPFDLQGLNLAPGVMHDVAQTGIKNITLSSNPEGISIAINGKWLPRLSWANGEVQHTISLAEETGLLSLLSDSIADLPQLLEQFIELLPVVQSADFRLLINFPPSE